MRKPSRRLCRGKAVRERTIIMRRVARRWRRRRGKDNRRIMMVQVAITVAGASLVQAGAARLIGKTRLEAQINRLLAQRAAMVRMDANTTIQQREDRTGRTGLTGLMRLKIAADSASSAVTVRRRSRTAAGNHRRVHRIPAAVIAGAGSTSLPARRGGKTIIRAAEGVQASRSWN